MNEGEFAFGLRAADIVLARDPRNAMALTARADALYAMGRPQQALAAYRAAVIADPRSAAAQIGLGRVLVTSDPKAAEAAFAAALAVDPDSVTALNDLGVARDMQGRRAEAEEAYKRALALSPGSADIAINLGTSLALAGRGDEAMPILRGVASEAAPWRKQFLASLALAGDGGGTDQTLPNGTPDLSRVAEDQPRDAVKIPANESMSLTILGEAPHKPVAPSAADAQPVDLDGSGFASTIPGMLGPSKPRNAGPPVRVASIDNQPILPEPSPREVPNAHPADAKPVAGQVETGSVASITPDVASITPDIVLPAGAGTGPYVQIGSLLTEAGAIRQWQTLLPTVSPLLAGRAPHITTFDTGSLTYWRLRVFGFTSVDEARAFCADLRAAGMACLPGRMI